ncbi:hypothetical protein ACHAXT_010364 [Thalassiosira profunda]
MWTVILPRWQGGILLPWLVLSHLVSFTWTAPMMPSLAAAWMGPARGFVGRTRRPFYNRVRCLSASGGVSDVGDRDDELQAKMRQLALLNGGKTINPRSAQQVSRLLYGNGRSQLPLSGNGSGGALIGPTDKATLQRMMLQIQKDGASDDGEAERRGEVAKLVLQCRELLSLNGSRRAGSSGSFASRVNGEVGAKRMQKRQPTPTLASFSTAATSSGDVDVIGEMERKSDGNVQEEPIVALLDENDDAIPRHAPSMSPYEQMVVDLFPSKGQDAEGESLDPYWMEPLLSLTKSSARALVRQLQSASCPMAYDPSASPITSLIANTNATAAPKRTTSLLSYIRTQKSETFSDSVVLVRVGDFYETYGVDAILLVEHCGLNPMAGKARAGCPWRNIQSTLDGLTRVGFRVAVFEEWNGVGEAPEGQSAKGGKLKTRYLAQVVSSANPTYMHGLVLKDEGGATDDARASGGRSYVGVLETQAGYTLVEISAEERTVVVSERLTAEAVSCRLVAYPPADPLFYVPPYSDDAVGGKKKRLDRLPFLPWRQSSSSPLASHRYSQGSYDAGTTGKVRVKTLPPSLVVGPNPGQTDVERAKQTVVSAFLRLEDDSVSRLGEPSSLPARKQEQRVVTHDDFVVVASSDESGSALQSASTLTKTQPLHLETATQLGLMSDPAIPPLVASLLPDAAPASSRRFLRRWLLIPPPPDVADAMLQLVGTLKDENDKALPSLNAPPLTGKVISLIRAGQASAAVYREILSALDAASEILLLDGVGEQSDSQPGLVRPLMKILHHDTGTEASSSSSLRDCFVEAMAMIESVVSTNNLEHPLQNSNGVDDDVSNRDFISYYGDVIPPAFFERNEAIWRGRVKPSALQHAHDVPVAARRLAEAIAGDFWGVSEIILDEDGIIDLSDAKENKSPVVQDIFNNLIALKSIPTWAKDLDDETSEPESLETEAKPRYFHPRDRNGKILRNRYTTEKVQDCMEEYVDACANARTEVERVLTRLSWDLVDNGHLPAVLQASHLNLILSTAAHHAASSNAKGWSTAAIYDDGAYSNSTAGHFNGVWPYWMHRSDSVSNSFDLDGLFLLTAPNMSGKSTLMRSTAAAALLINCGLCAPVDKGSAVRRFDSIFVRGASADVPTEDKSAFGAEMGDVAALLRSCGERSLVFVDEIGRGTSPKDGTSLAGAILEKMSEAHMSGMFATHLHGILKLPFSSKAEERLRKKRMAISEDGDLLKWTYLLEDGVCTNSLALMTAAKFGLPESILKRAEELSQHIAGGLEGLEGTVANRDSGAVSSVVTILEETAGSRSSVHIPEGYMSPPSLEGSSCVYVLQIGDEKSKTRYYVGETDSLSQRLAQHRSKGKDWSSLSTVAIQVESKTSARTVESLVIQRLAQSGFDLVSVADGTSLRNPGRVQ